MKNIRQQYYQIVLLVFLILNIVLGNSCRADSQNIKALEIIERIENTYQNLNTYHDKGIIFENFFLTEFETYYKNKNSFLFDWTENIRSPKAFLSNSRICMNKDGIFLYESLKKSNKIDQYNELEEVIFHSYAASKAALGNIVPLFFEKSRFRKLTSLEKPQLIGEETIDGERCFYLILKQDRPTIVFHLWILKNSNLIKKIKRVSANLETTYIFETVKINIAVPDSVFKIKD